MDIQELDIALKKARKGDRDGLAILYEHFYPKILKYLHYRVGAHVAEDLTADVFLRMLNAINSQKGSFTAWLYTIARNVATDHFRSAKTRRETRLNDDTASNLAAEEEPTDLDDAHHDIEMAIGKLTDDQRELITLKFIQGLSNAEIGEIMDRKQEAVRGLQFRALSALRSNLMETAEV
ncbi:MAG: sigma-70 family RNA polymerase sigma factor [Nitrospiraceae bacterium]|nr:sigma-70 family RNA polymerase sigma factor [Nitrospiraceae bacterium]